MFRPRFKSSTSQMPVYSVTPRPVCSVLRILYCTSAALPFPVSWYCCQFSDASCLTQLPLITFTKKSTSSVHSHKKTVFITRV